MEERNYKKNIVDNQELLYALLDSMPQCVNLWSREGEILLCNKEVLKLFQAASQEEFIDNFYQYSPEYQPDGKKSTDKAAEKIEEAYTCGRISFMWTHCQKNGSLIPTEVTFVRIPFQEDYIVVSYTRDMRQQLAMEEKIRKFNMRLEGLLDATPLCLNLWNKKYQNVMCNREAVALFELSNEQEYVERFFELSPEYQPDGNLSSVKSVEKIAAAFETGKSQFEWMHRKLDGEPVPSEITLVRVEGLGDDGEDMVAGYTRDLRPQLIAEQAERIASRRIRAVLDSSPVSCLLWNRKEEIIECNQVAVQMFDAESKKDLTDNFMDFVPEYQPDGTLSRTKMAEKFAHCWEYDQCIFEWIYSKRSRENVPCEVSLFKVISGDEEIIVAYSRDLRELRKTLEINEKLATLVNHDLLTGCVSRTCFMDNLSKAFQELNYGDRLVLFIFDIDYFKKVNDTYGHSMGDEVLKKVVQKVTSLVPKDAMVGRFGGDEFLIQSTGMYEEQAAALTDILVHNVADMQLYSGETRFNVTISIGAAFGKEFDKSHNDLLKRADEALYKAKRQGRNCGVVI